MLRKPIGPASHYQDRSGGTLNYLDPDGTVNYTYVPWDTLNCWLSILNGLTNDSVDVPSGVNRGKVIDELESRRTKAKGVVSFGARLVGRDLGYGSDWREYENDQGYTHLEELLVYQPAEWRKQAREYMFAYKFDVGRVSSNEKRQVTLTFANDGLPETNIPICLVSPVWVVLFHLNMQRSRRYEPLNFLLAYGVENPLPAILESIESDELKKDFLMDFSPLDYFFHFQEVVHSYKLDLLQSIGNENKFPRLGLIKELDFSDIVGQRLAKQTIREEVVQYVWNRKAKEGMLKAQQPLSMIFAGPSGNGKTELAQQLASIMNKPEDNCFIKVDCGKLTRMEEVFGLSGAYQGATEGSALNNFIIRMSDKPDSLGIVLLDEIEKARQCVIHGLYQVIDKGEWTNKKLSEGNGVQTETISCHNVIFIMTTNAADQCICDAAKATPQLYTASSADEIEEIQSSVEKSIRKRLQRTDPFTNAFMGRVGRIVPFFPMAKAGSNGDDVHPLMAEMVTVAKILIEREQDSVTSVTHGGNGWAAGVKQNMSSRTKDKVARIVVRDAVPEAGVRSIQKGVTAKMGKQILHSLLLEKGGIKDGSTVRYSANVDDSKVYFRVEEKPRCASITENDLLDDTFDGSYETAGDY